MILHNTIIEEITIGRKYSIIGRGYVKHERIFTIDSGDSSMPIDEYGGTWTRHGFTNSMAEYWGTQCSSEYAEHRKYFKLILCNQLIRIIPV